MEVSKYIVGYSIVELTTTMCYLGLLQPRVYEATKGDEKARNNSTYTVYGKVQNHKQNIKASGHALDSGRQASGMSSAFQWHS